MKKLTHRHEWNSRDIREIADKVDELVGWVSDIEEFIKQFIPVEEEKK